MNFTTKLKTIADSNGTSPLNQFKLSATLGTIGLVSGIGYGLFRRKGFWGCVGYGFIFSLLGAGIGTVAGTYSRPPE